MLSGSIKDVTAAVSPAAPVDSAKPTVVRTTLSDSELAATLPFEVVLKMRNFAELQARVAKGEVIPPAEMAGKYYPLASDYQAALAWIEGLGFKVSSRYDDHLSFFVEGSVARIRDALHVNFARVADLGGEYTSAVSAPIVPEELVPALVGINGLQPHLRVRSHHMRRGPKAAVYTPAPYTPSAIDTAYNATGLNVTGSGQTIGVIGYAYPAASDLTLFWQDCGVAQSIGRITNVKVGSGPSGSPDSDDLEEITLDAEWSSSMAPGAAVRIYGTSDGDKFGDSAFQKVISDMAANPQMRQVSFSYGSNEDQYSSGQMQTDSQYFATMASGGISVFVASGDGGSRPDATNGMYYKGDPLQVEYPASDPSVTGVGGTTLYNSGSPIGTGYREFVWNNLSGASGGGASTQFGRPNWQTGTGVTAGSQRLVPDVASSADPSNGAFVVVNGASDSLGGTSWSAPTWAGFCALFNEGRPSKLGPIALLNPKIYPLIGSPCFQDITVGYNGDYQANVGYDECTGIGSPNVGLLVGALAVASPESVQPTIDTQPEGQLVTAGQSVAFGVAAVTFSITSYQWQLLSPGTSTWTNLSDSGPYSGTATDYLVINDVTTGMEGDQVRCVVANAAGSVASAAAILAVPAVAPCPQVFSPDVAKVALGSPFEFNLFPYTIGYPSSVIGPITYQWYKDGQLLSGATSSAFSIASVAYSDSGDYLLAASNPGGARVVFQQTMQVSNPATPYGWLDAQQQGTIVYFLFSSPAQILRYDLGAGSWLAPVSLPGTPTAFRVAPEGVYVALGGSVSQYSPDLSSSVQLGTATTAATSIFLYGYDLFLVGTTDGGQSGVYTSFARNATSMEAPVAVSTGDLYFSQLAVSNYENGMGGFTPTGLLYGEVEESYNDPSLQYLDVGLDGTVTAPYYPVSRQGPYQVGTNVYVFPSGKFVADNTGVVYNAANLSFSGFVLSAFDDICFLADGSPVTVLGNEVTLFGGSSMVEKGRIALPNGAQRIFADGSSVFGFSAPANGGGAIGVEQLAESQLAASPRASAHAASSSFPSMVPDDAFVDTAGLVNILSKIDQSVYVWSPVTHQYVKTIPQQGSPEFVSYAPVQGSLCSAYDDRRVTTLGLGSSSAEAGFSAAPLAPVDVVALDTQVCVEGYNKLFTGTSIFLYNLGGGLVASNVVNAEASGYAAWNSVQQALYEPITGYGDQEFIKYPITANAIGFQVQGPFVQQLVAPGPLRFSGDSSLLVTGDGTICNAATDAVVGAVTEPFLDATWLGSTLFTINVSGTGAQVNELAGASYSVSNSASVPGYPLRLLSTPGGELVALTIVNGSLTMTVLDSTGNVIPYNPPVITAEPQGQTLNTGSTVVFSTAATGSVTYQWQLNGVNLADGANVSGSAGPQLVLGDVTAAAAGSYTCVVTSAGGSSMTSAASLGVETSGTPGAVSSLSSRAFVGTGDDILIGGFYISGSTSATVLVQAIGPALASYNVTGTLQHPALTIHQSQNGKDVVLDSNTGWGSNPVLLAAAAAAYAQPVLTPGSADSELLLTLPPGGYTAEVTGADGGTGVALCAIYQLP